MDAPPPTSAHAMRAPRVACASLCLALSVVGCDITGDVGELTDGGGRCDPLAAACGAMRACSLRADPREDACRDVEGIAMGAACRSADACSAGSQCVVLATDEARLDPTDAVPGACARICARDAPSCPPGERCVDLLAQGGGVRIDYGVCAP